MWHYPDQCRGCSETQCQATSSREHERMRPGNHGFCLRPAEQVAFSEYCSSAVILFVVPCNPAFNQFALLGTEMPFHFFPTDA
jgi:hypothetical protein